MKYELIKTNEYLLVVDDSEIKEGDLVLSKLFEILHFGKNYTQFLYKKIIAHLPLNNSPKLEGVDLLPPLEQEDDVEKLAEKEFPNLYQPMKGLDTTLLLREGFESGYNKAKEKYKYTEEDIREAYEFGLMNEHKSAETNDDNFRYYQSLSQPVYPIAFECEMKCGRCYMPLDEEECWSAKECSQGSQSYPDKHITTTNPDGTKTWVGKYIFEK